VKIHQYKLPEIIRLANVGELQLPRFQRDFVWEVGKIHALLVSLFRERPVGMATTWEQPRAKPHTEPIRFGISDKIACEFGSFSDCPAVVSLVLDGRQRITTLLHVFTREFHAKNAKYTHSNRWFINLEKDLESDEFIEYHKVSKLAKQGLDSIGNCLRHGRYPLAEWESCLEHGSAINSPATYPSGEMPDGTVLSRRIKALQRAQRIIGDFTLTFAEIGSHFDLSDVCEIFEILNTTGTRVSTFDLIHNSLFQHDYNLRETHKELSKQPVGNRLFGELPPEFYSQLVTTSWIARDPNLTPMGRGGKEQLLGIKAKHLLDTGADAYKHFQEKIATGEVADAVEALYRSIGGRFSTASAPYPVSLTLFIATWLAAETEEYRKRLHYLFRAYYYRNSLLKRYTQGYLTKHSKDLKFLRDNIRIRPGVALRQWIAEVTPALDRHFTDDLAEEPLVSREHIHSQLLDPEGPDGAQGEMYETYLRCRQYRDLLTGAKLDVFVPTPDDNAVELHHLYPRKWLVKNKGSYPDQARFVECLANRVPLTRKSNTVWSDKAPNTVLAEHRKTWSNSSMTFVTASIDEKLFGALSAPPTPQGIDSLWRDRAALMASQLYNAQILGADVFDD
jgi:hypothetical protein